MENKQEYQGRIRDERINAFLSSPLAALVVWAKNQTYSQSGSALEHLNRLAYEDLGIKFEFKENIWAGGTYSTLGVKD